MESLEQLQKTYAGKTDEELAELASDAYDLMEPAPQVLRAEIAKRGLKITLNQAADARPEPSTSQAEDEDPDSRLEVVASVRSPQEARLLQAALNSVAIRSCLGPDNAEDVDSFRGAFDKPVALKVYFPFWAKALPIIDTARRGMPPEFQHDPDYVEEEQPEEEDLGNSVHCPKCHSGEIVFEGRAAEPGSEPGPDAKFDWHCDSCGHVWEDDGIED
jgi:DNA-directed RNA polymerase subunit M/transcription elongation factor TFIIS